MYFFFEMAGLRMNRHATHTAPSMSQMLVFGVNGYAVFGVRFGLWRSAAVMQLDLPLGFEPVGGA